MLSCAFFYVRCKALPLCLWCRIVIVFHGFILGCFLSFLFCFESLGNWLGKEEVSGAQRDMNEI